MIKRSKNCFGVFCQTVYVNNEVFRLITKYCDNLRQIRVYGIIITDEYIKEFQQKFGPKIKLIYIMEDQKKKVKL